MSDVPGRQITTAAAHTARSLRRRLVAAARERTRRGHPEPLRGRLRPAAPIGDRLPADVAGGAAAWPERRADDARLDTLRGELVRELDRLAAADQTCSACFRRI